ncbi:MAG TPA: hypothetical protein VGI23_13050 [Steroidobacteraceae bacterium]|jgi:hypothetical protein
MSSNIRHQMVGRLSTTQSAAYTGTAATITNAVGTETYIVRVVCTSDAFIKIDNSPTATTSDVFCAASTPEYFSITPGQKVSAVQSSASGTLCVTEIT